MAAREHSCLVEEKGSGFCAGARWRVAGQGVDVREQHPPHRPTVTGDGLWREPGVVTGYVATRHKPSRRERFEHRLAQHVGESLV
jgi:hypothetical protein